MRIRVLLLFTVYCACLLEGCGSSRPVAHLIINNESQEAVPLQITLIGQGNQSPGHIITQTVQPGIQELPAGKFHKGLYYIVAEAKKGIISQVRPLSLDGDRWIIVNYMSSDSLNIQRKYGFVDTSILKKADGRYTGIGLYSENRVLPTLNQIYRK